MEDVLRIDRILDFCDVLSCVCDCFTDYYKKK